MGKLTCGIRCKQAKGPKCQCVCQGATHGIARAVKFLPDEALGPAPEFVIRFQNKNKRQPKATLVLV